jgi:hypothetical protein
VKRARLNRLVAPLLLALSLVALGYELARGIVDPTVRADLPTDPKNPETEFKAYMRLLDVRYIEASRAIHGSLEINLWGSNAEATIDEASFSPRLGDDDNIDWTLSSDCRLAYVPHHLDGERKNVESERSAAAGDDIPPAVRMACGEISLAPAAPAMERRYPFDRYDITLRPTGCVNLPDCSNIRNAAFRRVVLSVADRQLVPDITTSSIGEVQFTLRRPLAIRVLSVIFLAMAVLFLWFLVSYGDTKELFTGSLGFIATLWGLRALIVPPSVAVFPTAVDYAVLGLYCLMFSILLYRLPNQ